MFEALLILALAFVIGGAVLRFFIRLTFGIIRILFGLGGLIFLAFFLQCLVG